MKSVPPYTMPRRNVPILMYHSISTCAQPRFAKWVVSPDLFAQQIAYLADHHYSAITVTQLAEAMAHGGATLPARPIVLTFDDGFEDFYVNAMPVLMRHRFTATLYIVTGSVGGTSQWLRSEGEHLRRMLGWGQIADIDASGIECGAHSHTHRRLFMLPNDQVHSEVIHSKQLLEDRLGHAIASFAYPYGDYIARTVRQVGAAGFTSACSVTQTIASTHDNPMELPRLLISPATGTDMLASTLTKLPSQVMSELRHVGSHVERSVSSALWKCSGYVRTAVR